MDTEDVRALLTNPAFLALSASSTKLVDNLSIQQRAELLQERYDVVYASLAQSAQVLEYIDSTLQTLLENVDDRTVNVDVDFTEFGTGPFSHGHTVNLPTLESVRISSGGPPDPFVTSEGYFQTGTGFSGLVFEDHNIFLRTITLATVPGQNVWAKVDFTLDGQIMETGYMDEPVEHWEINKEINDIHIWLGNPDGKKQIHALNADVIIKGTGMTQEILDLQEAQEKLRRIHTQGTAELYSILRTKLVDGTGVPPGKTLTTYHAEILQLFTDTDAAINAMGAVPTETLEAMTSYGSELNALSKTITDTLSELEERSQFASTTAEKDQFAALFSRGDQSLVTAREAILYWQEVARVYWRQGLAEISPALFAEIVSLVGDDELHLLREEVAANSFTLEAATHRRAEGTLSLQIAEGTLRVHSLQGTSGSNVALLETNGNDELVLHGQSGMLDLTGARGTVVRANLTLDTTVDAENNIIVTFVRGSDVLTTIEVTDGTVSYENPAGFTGVLIQHSADLMTPEGRELFDYRQTYTPRYQNNDPGADYFFFLEERPEWYQERAGIIAEADKGDVFQPTTVRDSSFVLDIDRPLIADALTTKNNISLSQASSPRINSQPLSSDYWAFPLQYNPNEYNTYYMRTFGGGVATLNYIGYLATDGEFRALPDELITMQGNHFIVHPTGQPLHIAAVYEGEILRSNTPVNHVVHGEIVQISRSTLEETLRPNGPLIDVSEIKMMTMNEGGPLGWTEGIWHEESTGDSPVAIGWLKGRVRITNNGNDASNITVTTFSGFAGVPGWDTPQGTYQITLGPGESRLLTDDIYMNADQNGGSIARFVVEDDNGWLLGHGLRTVDAPEMPNAEQVMRLAKFKERWAAALAAAQEFTRQYFISQGLPVPSMGDPAMIVEQLTMNGVPELPSSQELEHRMRQAHRILAHAKESGNIDRIHWAQTAFNDSVNTYMVATGQYAATPSTAYVQGSQEILIQEEGFGGQPEVVLLATTHGVLSDLFHGSVTIQNVLSGAQTLTFGDGLVHLLNQHGTEIFSFTMDYFANRGMSSEYAEFAYNWTMQNGEAATAFTNLPNPIDAVKEMLRKFAEGVLDVPTQEAETTSDITDLATLSFKGSELTAFREQLLTQEGISVRMDSMAGRMYLWLADRLDNASSYNEVYDISKAIERYTGIPWWKIGTISLLPDAADRHLALKTRLSRGQYDSAFGTSENTEGEMIAAITNKYKGSAPDSPDLEIYRTFSADGLPGDPFIRVRFDVAMPTWANAYDHVDVYLFDRDGNIFKDNQGNDIEIKLTSQSIQDTLYVDIPLSTVTQHIDMDPLQSGGSVPKIVET